MKFLREVLVILGMIILSLGFNGHLAIANENSNYYHRFSGLDAVNPQYHEESDTYKVACDSIVTRVEDSKQARTADGEPIKVVLPNHTIAYKYENGQWEDDGYSMVGCN
ncbi:hypothetical protein H9L19_03830 [Weissella diestrammenae]|uniref:Uncharacterized protein n=1 Tax=Weissella diestrammenae TaxID=1162633 RepID=A0A7G9T7B4_9LACO|nr:hypothetical protein [Weissella diestrammenae]MCM0582001.1 hypothetical protein [Weissella diestrammenae]QNN75989.1 hypothetical protein H9L19_03830 [Weissella diestrammenae]